MPPLCGCRHFHVKLMRQVCISYKEYYAVNNCNWIGNNYTSRMLPNSRKCREGNLILFLFVAFFRLLLPWFVHIPRLFTIRTNHNWYTHSNFLAQSTHTLLILVVVSFWRFVSLRLLIILLCYTHMIIRTIIFIIIRICFVMGKASFADCFFRKWVPCYRIDISCKSKTNDYLISNLGSQCLYLDRIISVKNKRAWVLMDFK